MSQELKLLRLREAGAGSLDGEHAVAPNGVVVQCWTENGWQTVSVDDQFRRAFAAESGEQQGFTLDTADQRGTPLDPSASDVTAEALTFDEGQRALILLPGGWVWNGLETVPRAARRQSSAVGYMVEEQLAEDVEDLHFVCEPVLGDLCSVMAVASDKLSALKSQIERLQWPVIAAIPEYRLLAMSATPGQSALWLERDRAHFWQAAGRGLTVNRPLAGVVAESLFAPEDTGDDAEPIVAASEGEAPSLRLLGEPTDLELATFQQLGSVDCATGDPIAGLLKAVPSQVPGNLLSGEYQVSLHSAQGPWWKKPAIAVAACFALQLLFFLGAGTYYSLQASKADDTARNLFTEIFPGDTPSADLRRQVTGYLNQASGGGGEFAGQLQQLSKVWSTGKPGDLKLQSLRFDGNRGELVLQLRAANLGQLDEVVGKLSSSQYKAELLAANELEEGVSGRIRLK
ncbi:type II secretion system protein GspL [Microbulbifer sp. CAU 1566]|uniref:type II secretion system protein GspL n=1 Tax=Microbulbifer sp. CAU 1566 TaxID=2933269 RepID=UPI002002F360|nr:type II secretion system protein GspL [Microbulbifer sp. CAU 1566]MCK7596740.1 type II secretion system protein GspL [Microbulbifer sp. CAU 1566]